jgi:hypothetical protein
MAGALIDEAHQTRDIASQQSTRIDDLRKATAD